MGGHVQGTPHTAVRLRPMVTISYCQGCQGQFPSEDLDMEGLCVCCLDKLTEYESPPIDARPKWNPTAEQHRRELATKKRYRDSHVEERRIYQHDYHQRMKLARRD